MQRFMFRRLFSSIGKVISPLDFKPQKALIVTKVSRYEFERLRFGDVSEDEFEKALTKRGSDYTMIRLVEVLKSKVELRRRLAF